MTDTELLDRLRTGDHTAERDFYDRHVDRVYRLILRMSGRPELAQEWTQDTFIRVFRSLQLVSAAAFSLGGIPRVQFTITGDHQIRTEQLIRLTTQRLMHAVSKKADGGHAGHSDHNSHGH